MTMTATAVTATNHNDQLGEIFPMMLNELNCTFGVRPSFHVFIAVAVTLMVCGRHGIGPESLINSRVTGELKAVPRTRTIVTVVFAVCVAGVEACVLTQHCQRGGREG